MSTARRTSFYWRESLLLFGVILAAASCSSSTSSGSGPDGGSSGMDASMSGDDAGTPGNDAGAPGPSGLPSPPGSGGVPRPSGTPGNLKVLNWAGFKSALTYSFDDAQPSQVEHYDELQATGARLTFFVTSANSSGTVDSTFTRAVMDGHEIGNHTVHHCHSDLTGCSTGAATSLDSEIDDCTTYITSHLGESAVWTAASPYGDTGYDTPDQDRFFLNRGVNGGTISPNDATDPFNLPCHAAVDSETVDSFNTAIDGAHTGGQWLIMLVHTITPTAAIWYAPIDVSVVTGSIAHAQGLGDVWIDSMMNVGAYWRAQKVVAAAKPTAGASGQMTYAWTLPDHFPPGKYIRVTVDGGTLTQGGKSVDWNDHGYYEVALDAGALTLAP